MDEHDNLYSDRGIGEGGRRVRLKPHVPVQDHVFVSSDNGVSWTHVGYLPSNPKVAFHGCGGSWKFSEDDLARFLAILFKHVGPREFSFPNQVPKKWQTDPSETASPLILPADIS